MNTPDPLDVARDQAVDQMTRRAELEHEEKVAMFGKAAYEAWLDSIIAAFVRRHGFRPQLIQRWDQLTEDSQCAHVAAAQAVLDEARKAGWFK